MYKVDNDINFLLRNKLALILSKKLIEKLTLIIFTEKSINNTNE